MAINTINQQPTTITLQSTDLLLAWQSAQSPSTRSMPVSALSAYYAALTGATFTGAVSMQSTLTTNGAVTITAGGLTVTGTTSTINGALQVSGPLSGALTNYLSGMILSIDGSSPNTVLDISAGQCSDTTNIAAIVLPAFTKSTGGAWAAGSGSNGMGNGLTIANATWYHVFAIVNNGNSDVYFDTSVTAANAPTGTVVSRRIGSFRTDSSAHILPFVQNGDSFIWKAATHDVSAAAITQTSSNQVLVNTPLGVKVDALLWVSYNNSGAATGALVYSPDMTAVSGSGISFLNIVNPVANNTSWEQMTVRTDTAQHVQTVSAANSGNTLNIWVAGYIDSRGRQG